MSVRRLLTLAVALLALAGTSASGQTKGGGAKVDCGADPGALAAAIAAAAPGSTLKIVGTCNGPFTIDKNLTLAGPATLTQNGQNTVLLIEPATVVAVSRLTISDGLPAQAAPGQTGQAGGIQNYGSLTLTRSVVADNTGADGGNGDAQHENGGQGVGGGIFNASSGSLTLVRTEIRNNNGGRGGSGFGGNSQGGSGAAGGIENHGDLTIVKSSVHNNRGGDGGEGGIPFRGLEPLISVVSYGGRGGFGGMYSVSNGGDFLVEGGQGGLGGDAVGSPGGDGGAGGTGGVQLQASPGLTLTVTAGHTKITGNTAGSGGGFGGGMPDGTTGPTGTGGLTKTGAGTLTVTLASKTSVSGNTPDNCNFADPACV